MLPYPGSCVKKQSYKGTWDPLETDFKDELKSIIQSTFSPQNLISKKIFDKEYTAQDLVPYISMIFVAFQKPDLAVDTIFNMSMAVEVNSLIENCVDYYVEHIMQPIDYSNSDCVTPLQNHHEEQKIKTLKRFKSIPKMSDSSDEDYEKILAEKIEVRFNSLKRILNKTCKSENDFETRKKETEESFQNEHQEIREQEYKSALEEITNAIVTAAKAVVYGLCKFFTLFLSKC